jgi:ribonuclease D
VLIALAQRTPRTEDDLSAIEGLSRNGHVRYGEALLAEINKGMNVPRRQCPRIKRRRRRANVKSMVDEALGLLRTRSEEAKIDPTMVVTRSELTSLAHEADVADPDRHRLLTGWRYEFIGRDIMQVFLPEPAEPAQAAMD